MDREKVAKYGQIGQPQILMGNYDLGWVMI